MGKEIWRPEDLSKEGKARFVMDMFHRTMVHHTLWFREVEHQLGVKKALGVMGAVKKQAYNIQLNRLAKTFGFEMVDGIPKVLLDMSEEELLGVMTNLGVNWIANDGVWFQGVEMTYGMNDAKRCNDTTWTRYSPFEAWSIKDFLGLGEHPGLDGLKKALSFRMYGRVNVQSIIDEDENTIVFQMNKCRVQDARHRRGLPDYPCKSVGLVEYGYFAETVDDRVETECIGCPPDPHPEEWVCAWRFRLKEK